MGVSASNRVRNPPPEGGSPDAPMTRSTRPSTSASHAPPRTSWLNREPRVRRLPLAALDVEVLRHGPDPSHRHDGVDGDGEIGLPPGRDALHALLQRCGLVEQHASLLEQEPAGRRGRGAASAAVEQQHVELVLQPPHRVGDGGRHPVEAPRRPGEAAAAGDGVEHEQRVEVEA